MKYEIKHRHTGAVIYAAELPDDTQSGMATRSALEKAVASGADLYGADLYGANLRGANLRGANLYGANLDGANLYGANLRGANLYGANLDGANLDGANLRGADLRGADMGGANLDGEKLTKTPLQINNLIWFVIISDNYLRIGCQRHTFAEWQAFDDAAISRMESRALEFWRVWRMPLLAMCAAHAGIKEIGE